MKLRFGSPKEARVSPRHVRAIRERAPTWIAPNEHAAIVLLAARRGVVFLHEAYGRLGPAPDAPPLPLDAIFPMASISKVVTVTALMTLVEKGLVGLCRPVREYLPELVGEHKDRIQVHHLLTHTAGIDDDPVIEAWHVLDPSTLPPPDETQHPAVHQILQVSYDTPLAFSPGARMQYSEIGLYYVGEIVRRVSGQSLASYAQVSLFRPLGMKDTSYALPPDRRGRLVQRSHEVPYHQYQTEPWMDRPSPSSGVYATAQDMAIFAQMFLQRGQYGDSRVLSPLTVAAMTRNQIPGVSSRLGPMVFPHAAWGFGWSIQAPLKGRVYGEPLLSGSAFSHGGAGGVELWVDPDREIVGLFFSVALRADESGFSETATDLFMNMVTAAVDHAEAEAKAPYGTSRKTSAPLAPAGAHGGQDRLSTGSPRSAGVDPALLRRLLARARAWVESGALPGMVLLGARDSVIFLHEAIGHRSPQGPELDPHASFDAGPLREPLLAAGALILAEEGLLGLNRRVCDYLPEFRGRGKRKERLKVMHLLTHTSGLQDEGRTGGADWPQEAALIAEAPLRRNPGGESVWAEGNFTLLAEILSRVSGGPVSDFLQDRLIHPLGLNRTHVEGSRVTSTALDMAGFAQMLLNGGIYRRRRILSSASVRAMMADQIPGVKGRLSALPAKHVPRSLGWMVRGSHKARAYAEPLLSEKAVSQGLPDGCMLWVDPAHRLIGGFFCAAGTGASQAGGPHDLFVSALAACLHLT